tara:strand:- start:334 stop:624 length:291 start_codon:yes stop_codon:yes gene_type:complete
MFEIRRLGKDKTDLYLKMINVDFDVERCSDKDRGMYRVIMLPLYRTFVDHLQKIFRMNSEKCETFGAWYYSNQEHIGYLSPEIVNKSLEVLIFGEN